MGEEPGGKPHPMADTSRIESNTDPCISKSRSFRRAIALQENRHFLTRAWGGLEGGMLWGLRNVQDSLFFAHS